MKKISILILLVLLTGCGNTKTPTEKTIEQIERSKESAARIEVDNLLLEAEIKLLNTGKKCISVKNLNTKATSGNICRDSSNNLYAKDVKVDKYICNGHKNDLKCVGEDNDK